jgi:hypothetical protein
MSLSEAVCGLTSMARTSPLLDTASTSHSSPSFVGLVFHHAGGSARCRAFSHLAASSLLQASFSSCEPKDTIASRSMTVKSVDAMAAWTMPSLT